MIKKIESLSSSHFKSHVQHAAAIQESGSANKALFLNVEILDEAIAKKLRVQFSYIGNYGTDKKRQLDKNKDGTDRVYKVNPYQLAEAKGWYYLIGAHEYYPGLSNYRLDRIVNMKLLDEPVTPVTEIPELKKGFKLSEYIAENIYMFGGAGARVSFRVKKDIIKDVLDWFGFDVWFTNESEHEVEVSAQVNEDAMFYWALQYGENVEVLAPAGLRERIAAAVAGMMEKYNK